MTRYRGELTGDAQTHNRRSVKETRATRREERRKKRRSGGKGAGGLRRK